MFTLLFCLALVAGQVTQGRVKRSDDTNPLIAVVEGLSARLNSLEAKLASMNNHVSFMAQFSQETLQANRSDGSLVFDHVIFNEGNAYDPSRGIFTVPATGFYMFSTQVFTHATEWSLAGIYVRSATGVRVVSRMGIDSTGGVHNEQSVSTTAVVKLNQGDQVWVQRYSPGFYFFGQYHSFFTGALLHAN